MALSVKLKCKPSKDRLPNEVSEQTVKELLEYLISRGRMAQLLSSQTAPYENFIQANLTQ